VILAPWNSKLYPPVESGHQRQLSGFTRRVPHDHAPSVVPNRWQR
jgi:hypothetical protein